MKLQRLGFFAILAAIWGLSTPEVMTAQDNKSVTYMQMSVDQQSAFVREQVNRIAREMSGREYELTPEFLAVIKKSVDSYAARVGSDRLGKSSPQFVVLRGKTYVPTIAAAFKAHNVSPLIGIYIPFIESAYVNLKSPSTMGAIGLFQFLPQTGLRYGLDNEGLLDVEKSADAAARYIVDSINQFRSDSMSEALALLAYNRGVPRVAQDLQVVINEGNRNCSICALTASAEKLDGTFRNESIHYVPSFFAAAIVGENPRSFGIKSEPLSSYVGP